MIVRETEDALTLGADKLRESPLAFRRRVVRSAVKRIRGELSDIGFIHVEDFLRLLDAGTNFEYEFPGGMFIRCSGKEVTFLSSRPVDLPIIYCHDLKMPGTTLVPEIDVAVDTEFVSPDVNPVRPRGSFEIVMDRERILGKVRLRNWEPGDRIQPFGMTGSKKVQDIFVDAKIPREMRHRIPIIADEEKVIWVVGLAMSDCVRITENTSERLLLRISATAN
jgi:tRNA(Ile)-lysidine synthase